MTKSAHAPNLNTHRVSDPISFNSRHTRRGRRFERCRMPQNLMRSTLLLCVSLACALFIPMQAMAFCGNGVQELGEDCDVFGGSICCIQCTFRPPDTLCRPSSGPCDTEEFCTGVSTNCPGDGFKPNTTVCRQSPGALGSLVESTRGPSAPGTASTVSTKILSTDTFSFRVGAAGQLQEVDSNFGTTLESFVDSINAETASAPEPERVSAGLYDAAKRCQADVPGNTPCATGDDCPMGIACETTYLVVLNALTRGADYEILVQTDQTLLKFATRQAGQNDTCNPAEKCSGTGVSCGSDVYENATVVCRAAAGSCDIEETCPNDPDLVCAADTRVTVGNECRSSAGACDPPELCGGTDPECPIDYKSTAECRRSTASCDLAEVCDGISDNCPADAPIGGGTVCRAAAGDCDVAETCNGASLECPLDGFLPSTTECRADAGQCDVADSCTGASANCPTDSFEPYGTACTDGQVCTVNDICVEGVCVVDPMSCGDGVLQLTCGEECDDGDNTDLDGCSATCQAEPGLGCPFFPLSGCRQTVASGRSKILIFDKEKIGKLKFKWNWTKGAATTEAEFGDPLTDVPAGTSYTMCVYDALGLLAQATAPAGGICSVKKPDPCWRWRPSKGFFYKDSSQSIEPDGVKSIRLLAGGEGKTRILLHGRGGLFPFPSNGGFGGISDLTGISSALTVQLQNTSDLCFEATYSPPFDRQEPGRFQARSD